MSNPVFKLSGVPFKQGYSFGQPVNDSPRITLAGSSDSSGGSDSDPSTPPAKFPWAAALQAGVAVGSMIFNGIQNRINNRRNEASVERQNQWNYNLWKEQTAYNDVSNQLARMRLAGLNPALMYGNGADGSLASDPPQMSSSRSQAYQLDPLTAAQVANLNAQTQSIEHETQREDEKQPLTIEEFKTKIGEMKQSIEESKELIKSMKMEQQVNSARYLREMLDYSFQNASYNKLLTKLDEELRGAKIVNDINSFQLDRSMKILALEIQGFNLKNEDLRASIGLKKQEYMQSRDLFSSVKRKYKYDADKSMYDSFNLRDANRGIRADSSLKELSFFIDMVDNPTAWREYSEWNEHRFYNDSLPVDKQILIDPSMTIDFEPGSLNWWLNKVVETPKRVLPNIGIKIGR